MENLLQAVERHKELILAAERYIWQHPETGYREVNTCAYMVERFKELGYDNLVMAGDIPGFYTVVDTGKAGPEVLVLAEMDSLVCPNHPDSDPKTGYVHACGHNVQCAAMLGIAGALKDKEVLGRMCGKIRLCAVPAEELLEIEFRNNLINVFLMIFGILPCPFYVFFVFFRYIIPVNVLIKKNTKH